MVVDGGKSNHSKRDANKKAQILASLLLASHGPSLADSAPNALAHELDEECFWLRAAVLGAPEPDGNVFP